MKKQILFFAFIFITHILCAQQKGVVALSTNNPQPSTNNTYAVVVGISDYQDPAIPDLRFADKDAEAFANYLRSSAGGKLDVDHLKVLLNEKATVAQFAIALDWLMEVVKENDQVILYFSGHGDVEKKTITQPGYLLCWDAPARVYLAGGALALPMFQDIITTLSSQNKAKVIVIMDACRSGKLAGSSVGGSQITGANLAKQYSNEIKILSCQPNEYSIEGEQWGGGRGAFSYNLVLALYGQADSNNDLIVSLKEVGRYLEDHVTEEVAPVSQNPKVIGDPTEKIAHVNPKALADLSSGKTNLMAMMSPVELRGMEEGVLANLDTAIQSIYKLFNQSLNDKIFFEPKNACTEAYFTQLIKEPKLERLHSTMRRNYAAALMDDAQQTLNKYLKTDNSELSLSPKKRIEKYNDFPRNLERASELLGKDHYLYLNLQASKSYFEGFPFSFAGGLNRSTAKPALAHFEQALKWQPEMPNALWGISYVYGSQLYQLDSAELYAIRATEAAPNWVMPYVSMVEIFLQYKKFDKAKNFLELLDQIDSNSVQVWATWAIYHFNKNEYIEAERRLNKITKILDGTICLPCAQSLLTEIYLKSGRILEAEDLLNKLIQHDSTHYTYHLMRGKIYAATSRYTEAEQEFKKVAILASEYTNFDDLFYYNMVIVYVAQNKMDKAFESLEKSLMAGNDDFFYMQEDSDLAPLRNQTKQWNTLMKKYFPDKIK